MKWLTLLALVLEIGILGTGPAYADRLGVPDNPKWKEECGSCHIAYPPQLLTAADWQRLMGSLDNHFGDNASIDAKSNQEILAFLKRHAGSGSRYSASSLRISNTPWFTRAHHEVPSRAWSDPAVKSRANCTACHVNAQRGDWSERGILLPPGVREQEDDDD